MSAQPAQPAQPAQKTVQKTVQSQILSRLEDAFAPHYLMVENESHKHNVPPGAESHFKLVVVSDLFVDARPVDRHRQVYQLLAKERQEGVHALALHLYTPAEWEQVRRVPDSPDCASKPRQ